MNHSAKKMSGCGTKLMVLEQPIVFIRDPVPIHLGKKEDNFCYIWEKYLQLEKNKAFFFIGNTSKIWW